ncbi:lysophospholipase L1-like esterase [Shimia isoporae]|uniref:Lysophospholipase L1-like esterase n=1 Tax=Shimia isoporae TaxID=647720 RepID=A0A4R1N317_9RHOB|nr:SGNH/GDSL hydrolase family protein [Shimia isoporae]TCL00638.1 lysophospholipase L1-like esterase [Shimia isoporae]
MIAFDQIARIPLVPLLVAQGLGIRRRVNQLPEPPGARAGADGEGPKLRLLIIGDSSAAGVGATSQAKALSGQLVSQLAKTHRVHWRLEAATSATTRVILDHISSLMPQKVDVVVSALGVNDVTRASSLKTWVSRQQQLVDLISESYGAKLMVASGLPPMGDYPQLPQPLRWVLGEQAKRLDKGLADLAATHPILTHLPIDVPFEPHFQAEDGYHPSEEAYALWAELIATHIRENLKG